MKRILFFALSALIMAGCSKDESPTPAPKPAKQENPIAKDDALSGTENQSLTFTNDDLLGNDTMVENSRISGIDTDTEKGGKIVDNRDNTYTYTPPADFMGEDTFNYSLCIPGASDRCSTATVTVTVGDGGSPVAQDDSYETPEDKSLTIKNYLDNDQVVDKASVSSVNAENAHGTAVLQDNGDILYTPNSSFSGEDTFTYELCDDDETPTCSTGTITVNVIDEGNPSAKNDLVVIEAGTVTSTFSHLLDNDNAIDGAVITSIEASDSKGTVSINDDGTISYTSKAGFVGDDSFTYTICDDDPTPNCATATVTVRTIEPVSFNIPSDLADYYKGVVFSTDKEANYQVVSDLTIQKHTTILSYGQRHDYLYKADQDPNNPDNVILMYSGESRYWKEYTSDSNPYSPQTFNTEHIYPQSKLTSDIAVSDLHHLRSADASVNSLRLNYPYVDGSGTYHVVDGNGFYPGDDWRGDVARMVFYVNIRYGEKIDKVGTLDLFLKWNREDPVSIFEIQRNNVIEGAQGNRNPFIDNPYIATLIWGGTPAENRW